MSDDLRDKLATTFDEYATSLDPGAVVVGWGAVVMTVEPGDPPGVTHLRYPVMPGQTIDRSIGPHILGLQHHRRQIR